MGQGTGVAGRVLRDRRQTAGSIRNAHRLSVGCSSLPTAAAPAAPAAVACVELSRRQMPDPLAVAERVELSGHAGTVVAGVVRDLVTLADAVAAKADVVLGRVARRCRVHLEEVAGAGRLRQRADVERHAVDDLDMRGRQDRPDREAVDLTGADLNLREARVVDDPVDHRVLASVDHLGFRRVRITRAQPVLTSAEDDPTVLERSGAALALRRPQAPGLTFERSTGVELTLAVLVGTTVRGFADEPEAWDSTAAPTPIAMSTAMQTRLNARTQPELSHPIPEMTSREMTIP